MTIQVMSNGIQNVLNDQLIAEGLVQKSQIDSGEKVSFNLIDLEKRTKITNVLKKLSSEGKQRLFLNKDLVQDAMMTKNILNTLDKSSDRIRGYIQTISADPFGFSLLCEAQVSFSNKI